MLSFVLPFSMIINYIVAYAEDPDGTSAMQPSEDVCASASR